MSIEIPLHIPDDLYQRLKERAEQNHRTVEEELIEAAAAGIAEDGEDIPPDLERTLASLAVLNDETLIQAARSHLPLEMWQEIESLHFKQQREGLMVSEQERLNWLMRQYERAMLIRGEAAALLTDRGYDVKALLQQS